MTAFIDLTGHTFHRLTVISIAGKTDDGRYLWNCECSCGSLTVVRGTNLRTGTTRSCGCLVRDRQIESHLKHGAARMNNTTTTYKIWVGIIRRCLSETHTSWPRYGGRGISICRRWREFANFLNDMGERPPTMSIERLDNNLGYEPGNCIWADSKTQGRNKRNNVSVTICGERHTVAAACEKYGIRRQKVWNLSHRKKIPLTEAFYNLLDRAL